MDLEHITRAPLGERKPLPILLLHGAWHGAWCYDLWLEDFAAYGYETHAMSLPAHGKSPGHNINLYSMRDYVEALGSIIDAITPTPIVIAHSMGGAVLQHYLGEHAQSRRLPGAVLLTPIPTGGALPFYLRYARRHPIRYFGGIFTANLRRLVETPALAREWLIGDGAAMTPEELASRMIDESLRVCFEAILPIPVREHGVPMLILAGDQDPVFIVSEHQRTAAKHHATLEIIEGRSHDLMLEHGWRQTTARIREWIEATMQPQSARQ
jgi:pimeloyl-ACP methyl ester carboxylesterase